MFPVEYIVYYIFLNISTVWKEMRYSSEERNDLGETDSRCLIMDRRFLKTVSF